MIRFDEIGDLLTHVLKGKPLPVDAAKTGQHHLICFIDLQIQRYRFQSVKIDDPVGVSRGYGIGRLADRIEESLIPGRYAQGRSKAQLLGI
ncbi:MAG: hypothetical protein BWY50_01574 [Spirochaetes bacterium ADurb.Bin315]|nr:MAG: hypothetical protein BWY50_01574 [Spirochaetes bacterium ADurb.Bin315]